MYLIIFDRNCIKQDKEYFSCNRDYFVKVSEIFPKIKEISTEDVEEILLCSIAKEDKNLLSKCCKCQQYICNDDYLKIRYQNIENLDENCEQVSKRIFTFLYKQGLIKNNTGVPFVCMVNDYQTYMDIKENKNEIKYKSVMNIIEDSKKRHKWQEIINSLNYKEIDKTEYWNNAYCLNELAYALSKLVEPGYKKISDLEKKNLEIYFYKTINRCLELEPNNNLNKSILAYHYYIYFMYEQNDKKGYFEKAEQLYIDLIENSNEKYKELYRYTKLRELNFDLIKWSCGDKWINYVNEIIDDYAQLIDSYDSLTVEKQKKYKKEYIGALFGYSKFSIDNLLQYYESFVDNMVYNKPFKDYLFNKDKLESIPKIESYLNKIVEIRGFDKNPKDIDLKTNPGYFDIYYRLSQLEQMKGLIYYIKGAKEDIYISYFKKSNEYVDKVLDLAKSRSKQDKFNFPDYIKVVKAINMHFLKNYDECHQNFYKAKWYMIYEEAVLYYLQKDKENALKILKTIPPKDKCYNKAQLLIERISNEI